MSSNDHQPHHRSGYKPLKPEAEHIGPIYKHPYMIYVILTAVLFSFLLVMAYIAQTQGWIPSRGL